jgi:hypothetical protein
MSRTEACCGDLCTARRWDRVAAVVDQLDVRRVLCVPVQSDGRPVGMLNVFVTQPRPGREELMALGAFAALTAELVRTGVELVSKNLEVAQLRQALSSRVWIEQGQGDGGRRPRGHPRPGVPPATRAARASSRKLAEVAQEVVQDVQR